MWKYLFFALWVAACSPQGCGGQTLTVVLPAHMKLEEQAEIKRGDASVGYVETIESGVESKRAVLRVQDAAQFTAADRYLPAVDSRGKAGLRVIPGKGDPLSPGAVVEAFPSRRRPNADKLRNQLPDEQAGEPERQMQPGESASKEEGAAGIEERRRMRTERLVQRVFDESILASPVDTAGSRQYRDLARRLEGRSPADIAMIVEREVEPITVQLREESKQARDAGQMEKAKDLRRMEARLMQLQRQSGRLEGANPAGFENDQRFERRRNRPFGQGGGPRSD